ncbi:MAG: hypothetical protein QJR12_01200 [Mycobacterium sp.]|nr:hypothetical protein [Mycobacterium sp.]MDI3312935.1 hypothetical protein [Mycobacterium sp.]
MSQMPDGWSVEVEAGEVVVRFRSAWERHDHHLTAEEARALANELGVRYLLVSGALGVGDPDAVRSALRDYTARSVPALGIDEYAQQVYEALNERAIDAPYVQLAAEPIAESVEDSSAAEHEPIASADHGYEVRDYRDDKDARPRVEAWVPEYEWPFVRGVKYAGGWLVLADPIVAEVAGLGEVDLTGLDAVDADHALAWVNLLAALYVKVAARRHRHFHRPGSKGGDR